MDKNRDKNGHHTQQRQGQTACSSDGTKTQWVMVEPNTEDKLICGVRITE